MRAGYSLALCALALTALVGCVGHAGAASFKYKALSTDQTILPTPRSINSSDDIVGYVDFLDDNAGEGFAWSGGALTLVPGTKYLVAINNARVAVGEPSKVVHDYALMT